MSSIRGKPTDIGTSRKGNSSCIYPMVGLEKELGGCGGLEERSVTGDLAGISRSISHSLACVPGSASYGKGMLGGVVIYRDDCRGCVMHNP